MKRLWVIHLPPQRGYQTLAPSGYAHPIPPFSLGGFSLPNYRQSFFRGKIWFNFPMHFASKNFFYFRSWIIFTLYLCFFLPKCSFLVQAWQWTPYASMAMAVRPLGYYNPSPFRPRPPARVPWFFNTKFVLTSSDLKSCTFFFKRPALFLQCFWFSTLQKS